MADLLFKLPLRATDANDDPVSGALAYFYETGTTNPLVVYQDAGGLEPHATPVVETGGGVFPEIYVSGAAGVKVLVTDSLGAPLQGFPYDPVFPESSTSTGASSVTFAPTTTIPKTNVSDAIKEAEKHVAVSTNDTTPAVLVNKVTVTAPVVKTEVNDGANETLNISVSSATDSAEGVVMVLDEDDFASDSATKVPTQQSVKAYFTPVKVVDATALSGVSQVDVTDLSDYAKLIIRIDQATITSTGVVAVRYSSDNGSTFYAGASDYKSGFLDSSGEDYDVTMDSIQIGTAENTGTNNFHVEVDMFNATETSALRGTVGRTTGTDMAYHTGIDNQANIAFDAIRILAPTNFTGGTITVWGIRG